MQLTIENQTGFDLELKNSGSLVQSISSRQSVSIGLDNNGSYTLDYVESWLSSGLFSLIKSGVNVIKIQPLPHVEEQLPTNIQYTSGSFSGYAELQMAGDAFIFYGTNNLIRNLLHFHYVKKIQNLIQYQLKSQIIKKRPSKNRGFFIFISF